MSQLLPLVVELQKSLDLLRDTERRLENVPDWMLELHEEYSEQKAEIDQLEQAAEEAASERRQAELQMQELDERLKHYQQQMNDVSTQREYGALLQEIDTTKTSLDALRETSKDSLERKETAESALEEKRETFVELENRYQTEYAKWEAEKPKVTKEANKLHKLVKSLRGELPRGTLRQFERILERQNGQATAAVLRLQRTGGKGPDIYHCGACNYRVRPQTVVEINGAGGINLCESCKRILFVPAEDNEGDVDA